MATSTRVPIANGKKVEIDEKHGAKAQGFIKRANRPFRDANEVKEFEAAASGGQKRLEIFISNTIATVQAVQASAIAQAPR